MSDTLPEAVEPVDLDPSDVEDGALKPARCRCRRRPSPRPGQATQQARRRSNFEMYAWLFMRVSGIVLVFLVLGHLLIIGTSSTAASSGSTSASSPVAGPSPFWQVWDLLQLWLAMLHGTNGLRVVINDYAERPGTRFWLQAILYVAAVFTVVLGTLVIFTFDPNIG